VHQTGSLAYDGNGNMLSNTSRNITNIDYSPTDFLLQIGTTKGQTNFHMTYSGGQLKKTSSSSNKTYAGPLELNSSTPAFISFSDGRYNIIEDRFEYCIKDHLGNTVVRFLDSNGDGEITSEESADD